MDPESKKKFDEITRQEPAALSPGDIEFLKARRSYLSASELERYKDVLSTGEPEAAPADEAAKPAKKK